MAEKELRSIQFPGLEDRYVVPEGGGGGATGPAGKDGLTPTIGENGNWYLGDIDTQKPSRGEKGADGAAGKDGIDGYSPEATVTQINGGAKIIIKDRKGTTSVNVMNGAQGPKGDPGATDLSIGITGATPGQIAKITAVDTDGKPTAWEAVDMAVGGVEWYEVIDTETAEDVNDLIISTDKNGRPISGYHALAMVLCFMIPADSTQTSENGNVWVYPTTNGNISSGARSIISLAAWKRTTRTSNLLYAGSNRAMFMSSAAFSTVLDGTYNDVFNGVRLYVHSTGDHLPAGTKVRCLVLSKGWKA